MKKIICKVEYDTDTAALIAKRTDGYFGDPKGYEECLYVTESGKYFLYSRRILNGQSYNEKRHGTPNAQVSPFLQAFYYVTTK